MIQHGRKPASAIFRPKHLGDCRVSGLRGGVIPRLWANMFTMLWVCNTEAGLEARRTYEIIFAKPIEGVPYGWGSQSDNGKSLRSTQHESTIRDSGSQTIFNKIWLARPQNLDTYLSLSGTLELSRCAL